MFSSLICSFRQLHTVSLQWCWTLRECRRLLHLLFAVSLSLVHWRLSTVTAMMRRPTEEQNTWSNIILNVNKKLNASCLYVNAEKGKCCCFLKHVCFPFHPVGAVLVYSFILSGKKFCLHIFIFIFKAKLFSVSSKFIILGLFTIIPGILLLLVFCENKSLH